jgi:hypothetical protein
MIGGFLYGNGVEMEAGRRWYTSSLDDCNKALEIDWQAKRDVWLRKNPGMTALHPGYWTPEQQASYRKCTDDAAKEARELHWDNAWQSGAFLAITPIAFGWLAGWIVFRLGRWIRQGFIQ